MVDSKHAVPSSVSESEWKDKLDQLASKEEAILDQYDNVRAERRRLPTTEVTESFVFESAGSEKSLADMFDGNHYLIVYHFMYAPEWVSGCPMCTSFVNGLGPKLNAELNKQGSNSH